MQGDTVQIRLVGVNVDNRADGKGKAGLTFMTTTYVGGDTNMADTNHNAGGYRDVRIRKDYNEEKYKSTISDNVYNYLTPVLKIQNNHGNDEMNNLQHSATSNAIVERVSIPSPLELDMSVGGHTGRRNDYPTPAGLIQYNPYDWWQGLYNYLYSGNATYEYYKNNTGDVSEYCKLLKGSGEFKTGNGNLPDSDACKIKKTVSIWLRSTGIGKYFPIISSIYGTISYDDAGTSYYYSMGKAHYYRPIILLSF